MSPELLFELPQELTNFILNSLSQPASLLHWGWLAAYLVLVYVILYKQKLLRGLFDFSGLFKHLFPKKVYRSHSFYQDIFCFSLTGVLLVVVPFSVTLISFWVGHASSGWAQNTLQISGSSFFHSEAPPAILFTLTLVLSFDFGSYVGHYLLHKLPFLWEFHKYHHSAKVLTPLTQFRGHPIEVVVRRSGRAIFGGLALGAWATVFPKTLDSYNLTNLIPFALAYFVTVHLRHSHIPLSFGPRLSYIFNSPSQHHIHHSTAPEHLEKNFGVQFSIWDALFGTLYIPSQKEENLNYGLVENRDQIDNIGYLQPFWIPFVRVVQLARHPLDLVRFAPRGPANKKDINGKQSHKARELHEDQDAQVQNDQARKNQAL